jgi:hypothetical protein
MSFIIPDLTNVKTHLYGHQFKGNIPQIMEEVLRKF